MAWAVLEQPPIWVDTVGACGDRGPAQDGIIVLAHGEDPPAGGLGKGDGGHSVVGARGQVHDDAVHVLERRLKGVERAHRHGVRACTSDKVGKAGGPHQIVGEDGDPGGQSRASAR